MLNADDILHGENFSEIGDGNAYEADQNTEQGTADNASNALSNQASMATATSQTATQPLPPPDPLDRLQPTVSEQSQQEQPREQAKSNGRQQVQVVLDRHSGRSTTDLDESAVRL